MTYLLRRVRISSEYHTQKGRNCTALQSTPVWSVVWIFCEATPFGRTSQARPDFLYLMTSHFLISD